MHPSLLPRWRGPSPVVSPIMNGDPVTGVSVMLMDEGMDTGPVFVQERVAVPENITGGELTELLASKGATLLAGSLDKIRVGKLKPVPQDEGLATVSAMIGPEITQMDWNLSPVAAARRINALSPKPGVKAFLGDRMVKLLAASPLDEPGEPGVILRSSPGGLTVGAGTGAIRIERVHPEGRNPMDAASFANGWQVRRGMRFENGTVDGH